MLPFIKRRQDPGLIVKTRPADEKPNESEDMGDPIKECAQDLIAAVHAHDAKGAAEAIRAAFQILDSEPHEEGPHEDYPQESQGE